MTNNKIMAAMIQAAVEISKQIAWPSNRRDLISTIKSLGDQREVARALSAMDARAHGTIPGVHAILLFAAEKYHRGEKVESPRRLNRLKRKWAIEHIAENKHYADHIARIALWS